MDEQELLALSEPAWRLAARILGGTEGAEDVVQQSYLAAVREVRAGSPPAELRTWFLTVVANAARKHLRAEARRARREAAVPRDDRTSEGPGANSLDREQIEVLRGAMTGLDEKYRVPVALCCEEGLSQREAAVILEMPESTVSKYVGVGLDRLRQALSAAGYAAAPAALIGGLKLTAPAAPAGLAAAVKAVMASGALPAGGAATGSATGFAGLGLAGKLVAAASLAVIVAGGATLGIRGLGGKPEPLPVPAVAPLTLQELGPTEAVLDQDSTAWRGFKVLKPADVRTAGGKLEPRTIVWEGSVSTAPAASAAWPALPPADWAGPDFDDSAWEPLRLPLRYGGNGGVDYGTALILLRGRFEVKDPAQVRGLVLSLGYFGGAVVRLNGKEVARGHVAGDKPDLQALAEDYPPEAFACPDGKPLYDHNSGRRIYDPKAQDLPALRGRKLSAVTIPAAELRKGVNVLAVEVHRAPVHEALGMNKGPMNVLCGWPPVGLEGLALAASPPGSVAPNLGRPAGIRVRSCEPFETVTAFDRPDPFDLLRPIAVHAAANGVFSGRLAVGSGGPIKGLKTEVSDLARDGGGSIPASAVRVRYAEPAVPAKSWAPPERFDGLIETIPTEVLVTKAQPPPAHKQLAGGAVASLWLTVRVPKDAAAGLYQGSVTVSAEGLNPTAVPFRITVAGWAVPDPRDFRITNFAYLSEDAQALHYGVERWSDKHFELMGKSMALMAEINSRQAIVNLAVDFYGFGGGNAESLVRWVKQPDGSFRCDYAILDKYLELVAKTMGKPTLLRVNCWGEVGKKDGKLAPGAPNDVRGKTLSVTVLDPATGKLEPMEQPCPGTEESYKFWKPVLDEVRKKVEARGWWDVTAMGWNSYCFQPIPEVVSVYKRIWPDGRWSYTAHNGTPGMAFRASEPASSMPVLHADCVWTHGKISSRGCRALFPPGRRDQGYWCFTWRSVLRDWSELAQVRSVGEDEILRGHDGLSDFGADLFPVKKPGGGYWCLPNGRGTGGPSDGTKAMLAPGPDGAISTERFEMLREGMELAEAVLFIQRALEEKKLGADLAQRAEALLEERGRDAVAGRQYFSQRFIPGRFEQDGRLLALAGEVARAVGGK